MALETDGRHHEDLRIGAALAAQGKNLGFEFGAGPARLALRNRRAVLELGWEAAFFCPREPATNSPFADVIRSGDGPEGNPLTWKLSRPHGVLFAKGVLFVTNSEAHRILELR